MSIPPDKETSARHYLKMFNKYLSTGDIELQDKYYEMYMAKISTFNCFYARNKHKLSDDTYLIRKGDKFYMQHMGRDYEISLRDWNQLQFEKNLLVHFLGSIERGILKQVNITGHGVQGSLF